MLVFFFVDTTVIFIFESPKYKFLSTPENLNIFYDWKLDDENADF